jgi:hypothetical protein
MKTKRAKKRGTARMRELGQVAVIMWLDASEVEQLDQVRGYSPRASWALAKVMAAVHADHYFKRPA